MRRIILKRLLVLAAMAATVLIAAIPVLADTETSQNVGKVITQEHSSESESAEIDQAFNVDGGGDNTNQCAGLQGVGNTASQDGGVKLIQYDSEVDDFDFEDVGGHLNILQADSKADNFEFDGGGDPLTIGGTSETSCGQDTNQSGSASG